jgi:hypothetical protein
MSHNRWSVVWCVVMALMVVGCKSTPEPEPESVALVEAPVDVEPEPEPEPEPSFCAKGEEEYTRKAYTWCATDGVMTGNFLALGDSGKVVLEGAFAKGVMHGTWTGYDPNTGKLRWKAVFVDGEEHGAVEIYGEQGALIRKVKYDGGVRQGVSEYYDEEGNTRAALNYESGKPAGTWTYWHANGKKSHEYTFKKPGGKTSIHKHWTPSGKKTSSPAGRLKKRDLLPGEAPLDAAVVECYTHSRIMDDASGKLVAQIHIGYGGEVSRAELFSNEFQHPFMSACIMRSVEALKFPDNPYGPQQIIHSWTLGVQ